MRNPTYIMRHESPGRSISRDEQPVRITLLHNRPSLRLKSWLPDRVRSHGAALGPVSLPGGVGATADGQVRILCVGPDEWLIVASGQGGASKSVADAGGTAEKSAQTLAPLFGEAAAHGIAAVDSSEAFSILSVEGAQAREVLAKGCGLDLRPESFPPGKCARTRFAKMLVILDCREQHAFELYIPRSYAAHLENWLGDAAAEFTQCRLETT